ncbi:MAG: hypothetical protein IPH16_01180 [Haliscomenobacter sp.]|nr:hypothetical protein [Haliscomenobacter sp.]MBK7477122.1 hypothetical protein [Haliscomenobacter sp.]MBK8878613.1 hypothetical protein [Haliscomenobacter sp.]
MKIVLNSHLPAMLLATLLAAAACTQVPGKQAKERNPAAATPLTMEQAADGKWVLVDSQKTPLYDVFIYDNGPDYPAEGLIRVVKNGKIGYADAKTYAIVIEPQFDCAFPFENGKAKVSNQCQTVKDGEYSVWESDAWQYVDQKGVLKNQD